SVPAARYSGDWAMANLTVSASVTNQNGNTGSGTRDITIDANLPGLRVDTVAGDERSCGQIFRRLGNGEFNGERLGHQSKRQHRQR
ncbi:hypothetical protein EPU46_27800, partial [Escherichia coli]